MNMSCLSLIPFKTNQRTGSFALHGMPTGAINQERIFIIKKLFPDIIESREDRPLKSLVGQNNQNDNNLH
jgi:hypothetical protein